MPERLVLCGGARGLSRDPALRLALCGRSRNITLKLEDISQRLVENVPNLLVDLAEIATYVYCADQATSRGGEAQTGMGRAWRRSFRFIIPVRNPDHWSQNKVSELLCDALSFLSEDDYAFEFEEAINPPSLDKYLDLRCNEGTAFKADEVVLFSGGLDSLGGAVEELSAGTKKVAMVSHRSSSKIFDHQKHLVSELKARFPKRVMHVPVLITRQEPLRVQEHTQRSRSFLYAALACVVARLFGNTRIRFFENGVVSINLPISEQVVGARATRTTHPLALDCFREFFSAAVGKSIEVDNPFIWKTKADVIRSIVHHGCGPLIKHTISCTRSYDITRIHSHCGCCSQCLDRRFAVLAADAAEHDPAEMYKVELLTGARDRPHDQTMAESYVRTALELHETGERGFFDRFSGETARVCSGFPVLKSDDVARQVLDLHRRHGQSVWDALTAAIESHSAELIRRSLPLSSVLMMTVTPGSVPELRSIGKRSEPLATWIAEDELESPSMGTGSGRISPDRERLPDAVRRGKDRHEQTEGDCVRTAGKTARGKSRPALERARGAIKEIYPSGVPGQDAEPNVILCRRVGDKLKQAELPGVSNDTILRAAGRRK